MTFGPMPTESSQGPSFGGWYHTVPFARDRGHSFDSNDRFERR
jgi:hypothetical protein